MNLGGFALCCFDLRQRAQWSPVLPRAARPFLARCQFSRQHRIWRVGPEQSLDWNFSALPGFIDRDTWLARGAAGPVPDAEGRASLR